MSNRAMHLAIGLRNGSEKAQAGLRVLLGDNSRLDPSQKDWLATAIARNFSPGCGIPSSTFTTSATPETL